jgi:hypothetical protein
MMSENGEHFTPREEAQIKAERTVRDAWLAVTTASKMFSDPVSRPYIENCRDDILSMRTKLDLLASAIMENGRG